MLQQAASVLSWAIEFDPKNVNFDDLKIPKELKKITLDAKNLVKDLNVRWNNHS